MARLTGPRFGYPLMMVATALAAATPVRADFTLGNPGGTWTEFVGQNFSPSVGATPDPGLAPGDSVYLTGFTFTSSGGVGAAETRLAILPSAYYDTNGDPDGSFSPTVADAVGLSINSFDTAGAAAGDTLAFAFDALALTYGENYTAAFVTVGGGEVLTFQLVGAYGADWAEVSPGVWQPSVNYGGAGNFNAAALSPDTNGDGYFQAFDQAGDASFTATIAVPEPATAAWCGVGLALVTRRRGSR